MKELKILGPVELRDVSGNLEHSFLAGPKRLALLAFLVLNRPRGFHRRDRILPLLWPEKGQKNARNSLSNLLYHIRKTLGSEIVITRGTEEIGIDTSKLWCDALEFEELIKKGELLDAVNLYRSDLLEGLHIANASADFEQWIDLERQRFRNLYGDALEALALQSEKKGETNKAIKWWQLSLETTPYDTHKVKHYLKLLTAIGSRAEVIRIAEQHASFLHRELDIDPREVMDDLTKNLDSESKIVGAKPKVKNDPNQPDYKSVAILPFEELGKNEDTSNFAGGLHNDLLTRLSTVSSLNVISRTSVLQYRNTNKPIPQISAELGAGTIVEGSIQFKVGRIRLNIQLIDVITDKHIWAETYDRELTAKHFFDIQSDLTEQIVENLRAYLTPKEKQRIKEWNPTKNMEAYRCYSIGRRELDKRTKKSMQNSLKYFNQAVELDPGYALAWIGLADALGLLHNYGYQPSDQTISKAKNAINQALDIDPNLPEAHASKALIHSTLHEGPDSIKELLIAVDLQASYAEAHNWLSWNYQLLGEAKNALESARRAVDLDPLSPEANSNLSFTNLINGFIEEGLTEVERTIDLHPEWTTPIFYKSLLLYQIKRFKEAKMLLNNLTVTWAGDGPVATKALCNVAEGNLKNARELINRFINNQSYFAAGLIYAALKECDKAIDQFLMIDQWDEWPTMSIYFLYPDVLDAIRNHPQYREVIKNVRKSWGQN